MKKLNVPYISQWDENATFSKDDCVPTCAAMLVAYHGGNITPNQLTEVTGAGLVDFDEISLALKKYGYKIIGAAKKGIQDLKDSIDKGIPFIAIIHYGDLPGRQDTYAGGHAVVVVGYDDKDIYTNDPDWWSPRRNEGAGKKYPISAFEKAWKSTADGNLPGNFWYLDAEIPGDVFHMSDDIPTEVENAYELKSKKWYDKYWSFDDYFKETVEGMDQLAPLEKRAKLAEKDAEESRKQISKVQQECDDEIIKIRDQSVQAIEDVKTNFDEKIDGINKATAESIRKIRSDYNEIIVQKDTRIKELEKMPPVAVGDLKPGQIFRVWVQEVKKQIKQKINNLITRIKGVKK